ncbi:hypothetical protein FH972_023745 [Carpinus fangiana]|uniref:Uncharacterized protein n=1 Tax=Carpinus fangiana TaxID=176857 RepID=A0A5N6KYJ4_9ROSI|nr:hypothetical protein FH972_023745 [Carpinus fangiana]
MPRRRSGRYFYAQHNVRSAIKAIRSKNVARSRCAKEEAAGTFSVPEDLHEWPVRLPTRSMQRYLSSSPSLTDERGEKYDSLRVSPLSTEHSTSPQGIRTDVRALQADAEAWKAKTRSCETANKIFPTEYTENPQEASLSPIINGVFARALFLHGSDGMPIPIDRSRGHSETEPVPINFIDHSKSHHDLVSRRLGMHGTGNETHRIATQISLEVAAYCHRIQEAGWNGKVIWHPPDDARRVFESWDRAVKAVSAEEGRVAQQGCPPGFWQLR